MRGSKFWFGIVTLVLMLMISACSSNQSSTDQKINSDQKSMDMGNMNMNGSSEVLKGLKEAKNPTYKVGSHVIVHADHMEGMNGAKGTVVGAYDTTAYAVTYTPTDGGPVVTNHKWVIQEELKNAGSEPLKAGTEVTLKADHMKGMMGAKGTIDSEKQTTVYMINYTPTNGSAIVKNHKWVIENELSAK